MAGARQDCFFDMILLGFLFMASLSYTVAQVGVCYGILGNDLPSPADTVALYNQNNIRRMRIYDAFPPTLQALSGSNIELMLGVPNTDLQNIAASQGNANTWVQNNVRNYPNVRFRYIAVGNEVSPVRDTAPFVQYVLPAMQNIYNAIRSAGLGDRIRVSTSIETGVLQTSYPPSNGAFRDDVLNSYLRPIIGFLADTRAPLFVNVYPYFAYIGSSGTIDLQYARFSSPDGVLAEGTRYQNLFSAMVDAMYAALDKAGGSSLEIVVSETGWPSSGRGDVTSVENARLYNTNLIQRVRDGTPRRPGREIETYNHAMYDENQKEGAETERHFGLFTPNRQPKYSFSF